MNRMLVISLLIFIALSLAACSSKNEAALDQTGVQAAAAPSIEELRTKLFAEFERLGIDPDKTPSTAPSGPENEVFDLSVLVLDADGPGGNPPTGIELKWTERIAGDYDQNGEVGISDLTPLGANFSSLVTYDDPGMHNGFPHWPQGNPTNDGGAGVGNPPAAGSPAENWRMARIDGDMNGELNISDITPIASHWAHRIDGYRVYRLRPGDPDFILQPDPLFPAAAFTIPKPGVPTGHPVRYTFTDTDIGPSPAGYWEYYVAPYCDNDSDQGPESNFAGAPVDQGQIGGHQPVAVLTADVMSGAIPLTVTFELAGSYDPDGTLVAYEWDMDQNPSTYEWDSFPATQLVLTYNTAGSKDQWARIRDNDGNVAMANIQISVAATPGGNLPPIAELHADPPGGHIPLLVTWRADWSHDPDGTIVKYEWDMDQTPATFEYDSGAVDLMQITYNSGGVKRQYVRVTDNQGATDTGWAEMFVDGPPTNQSPVASFIANPASGAAPQVVNFNAAASTDPDGHITQFEWDYEGTGTFTAPSASDAGVYTYNTQGAYTPTLRVTDNGGATATISVPVQIYPPGGLNQAPTAAMTHYPITGAAPLAVTFDGSTSTDADGSIVNYGWDFDTDGTIDLNTAGPTAANTFTAVNNWTTTLTVTDDKGAMDSTFVFTNVTGAGGPNQPPVAALTATPSSGPNPLTVNFDATGSSDPDGTVTGYAFDFDGDMIMDQSGATGTATHIYTVPGTYSVWLVVYDDKGAQAGLYKTITVSPGATYWHVATAVPSVFDAQGCSLAVVQNFPAVAYTDRNTWSVAYARAKDVNGTGTWSPRVLICVANQWVEDVSLAMINGRPAVAYQYPNNAYTSSLFYDRADDAFGTSWTSGTALVSLGGTSGRDCKLLLVNGYPAITHTKGNYDLTYHRATNTSGSNWASGITIATNGGWNSDMVICQGNPAVCHYYHAQKVYYQRSNNINGATWATAPDAPTVKVDDYGGQYCSMIVSGGKPMICYFTYWLGNDSLKFSRATDKYGNSWTTPVTLDSGSSGIGLYCDIAKSNGIPYICYRDQGNTTVKAIFATDSTAASWGTPEVVANDICFWISCAEVNSKPAVAWCSSQGIEYAIKY